MDSACDENKIQSFSAETQNLIKIALQEPADVDLVKVCDSIVDESLKDESLCRDAGCVCYALVQLEAKRCGTSVLRSNLLTRLQREFTARGATRSRSVREWVCVASFICNTFDCLKVNNAPLSVLVGPVFDCLFTLARPESLVNEEEVNCLSTQLHRVGEQLEKQNPGRMDELFFMLRDAFLLQDGLSSLTRLVLLEVLEFRAGGWALSTAAHRYYYSEVAD